MCKLKVVSYGVRHLGYLCFPCAMIVGTQNITYTGVSAKRTEKQRSCVIPFENCLVDDVHLPEQSQ